MTLTELETAVSNALAAATEGGEYTEAPEPSDEPGSPYVKHIAASLYAAGVRVTGDDLTALLDGIRDEVREAVLEGDAQDCSSADCIADAVWEIVRVRVHDAGVRVPDADDHDHHFDTRCETCKYLAAALAAPPSDAAAPLEEAAYWEGFSDGKSAAISPSALNALLAALTPDAS